MEDRQESGEKKGGGGRVGGTPQTNDVRLLFPEDGRCTGGWKLPSILPAAENDEILPIRSLSFEKKKKKSGEKQNKKNQPGSE